MSKSPAVCPFGPSLQKYWDRRHKFFSRFDEGIQIDEEGLFSVIPEQTGLEQAKLIQGEAVLDGFAGVGGAAIAYARSGKRVIAVDIDAKRLDMAKHNAAIYGVEGKITFMKGDFFDVAKRINADTVTLDPPWGGPSYKELGIFRLVNFEAKGSGAKEVDGHAMLRLSLNRFKEVLLRVPTNFDMTELEQFRVPYTVHDDFMEGRLICRTVVMRQESWPVS